MSCAREPLLNRWPMSDSGLGCARLTEVVNVAFRSAKSLKEQLIGTWTIVLCEAVQPDGASVPTVIGSDPAGQYIITDHGHSFAVAL
jgi:hypothetical protein